MVFDKKEYKRKFMREYCQRPDIKIKRQIYMQEYSKSHKKEKKIYNKMYHTINREKISIQRKVFRDLNKDRINKEKRIRYDRLRLAAVLFYSNFTLQCAICGESRYKLLNIDHVQNDGKLDRKLDACVFYQRIMKENNFKRYQVLCSDCNRIKYLKSIKKEEVMKLEQK